MSTSLPEGFEPVMTYPDGKEPGVPSEDRVRHTATKLVFQVIEYDFGRSPKPRPFPALPFKGYGELHHTGWDIPTRWAIDANGQAWMDNAHGHPLHPAEPQQLIGTCENESARRRMQKLLGRPVDRPEWVQTALRYGWTPPDGWKDPD